jgi:hypothetical protein
VGSMRRVRSVLSDDRSVGLLRHDETEKVFANLIVSVWLQLDRRVFCRRRAHVIAGNRLSFSALRRRRTATSITQCIYSSVSRASLQKTGIFLDSAGDFWEFSAQKVRTSVSRDYWR